MDAMQEVNPIDVATVDLLCDAVEAAADFTAPEKQLEALKTIGLFLENGEQYIVDSLLEMGLVSVLLDCLKPSPNFELQHEAIKVLSKFGSCDEEHHDEVIDCGALPLLMSHLTSPSLKVCNSTIWALGNIIGDDATVRDTVLGYGIIQQLVAFIRNDTPQSVLVNVAFTLSNVCRCEESNLPKEAISVILPVLKVLLDHPEAEIQWETLKAVRHLMENIAENIGSVVNEGLVPRMVELLKHAHTAVHSEALRALGQVVCGSIEETNVVLNCGFLAYLPAFLTHDDTELREEACWIATNIAGGNVEQIQGLIDAGVVRLCVDSLRTGPFPVQKQVVSLIENITYREHAEQMYTVLRYGAVEPLCALLGCDEPKVLKRILSSIRDFIKLTISHGHSQELATLLNSCGGIDKIRMLQDHNTHAVKKRARLIITKYVDAQPPNAQVPSMPSPMDN